VFELLVTMKSEEHRRRDSLYLEFSFDDFDEPSLPLRTSVVLLLLSYCKSKSFKVFLVSTKPPTTAAAAESRVVTTTTIAAGGFDFSVVQLEDVPELARSCRLPAVLDDAGRRCRAGLAVVLRHVITRTAEEEQEEQAEADPDPSPRKAVLELLGFKKTCLKACAEVALGSTCMHQHTHSLTHSQTHNMY